MPGFGVTVNGARRWLGAGPLIFQPSEIAKLALVLYAAKFLAERPRGFRRWQELVPLGLVAGLAALLVASQPDLGTALVIAFTIAAMLIASGVPIRWLGGAAGVGGTFVLLYAMSAPYRRERLTSFLDPWHHAGSTGFQAVQGQIALGSGGLFGRGLGESVQKIFYLPEAHTDFILAVIGEELGLVGVLGLLVVYGVVAWAGLRIAQRAKGRYAALLAAGLTSLDPLPGDAERLRRARDRPADGRAAAVHLLRLDEPRRAAGGRRPAAEHRARRVRAPAGRQRRARSGTITGRWRRRPTSSQREGRRGTSFRRWRSPTRCGLTSRAAAVVFIGGERAERDLVPAAGYELRVIAVEGLSRTNPLKALRALVKAAGAVVSAWRLLGELRPVAVMGGGGYVAGPVGLAAVLRRIPLVLTEADSHLGVANRLLAPFARRVCLAFPLDGRATARATASPAGRSRRPPPTGAAARARFGIAADERVLRRLRRLARRALDQRGRRRGVRRRPATSTSCTSPASATCRRCASAWRRSPAGHYDLRAFIDGFGDALLAGDLVVARAGGSIFEIAAAGGRRSSSPTRTPPATTRPPTRAGWSAPAPPSSSATPS